MRRFLRLGKPKGFVEGEILVYSLHMPVDKNGANIRPIDGPVRHFGKARHIAMKRGATVPL